MAYVLNTAPIVEIASPVSVEDAHPLGRGFS
jgi:hypothetical protein